MYFVSEVLSDSKTCYSQMQKLVYAVLVTKRKLQHYFDAHPITVVSSTRSGKSSRTRGRRKDSQMGAQADGAEHSICYS
jgi:hypothetical protein